MHDIRGIGVWHIAISSALVGGQLILPHLCSHRWSIQIYRVHEGLHEVLLSYPQIDAFAMHGRAILIPSPRFSLLCNTPKTPAEQMASSPLK